MELVTSLRDLPWSKESITGYNIIEAENMVEALMATYECSKCGMSVNATCGKCNAPLVNDSIKLDDGTTVQVSKCPNGHGKIKSPMCCGVDMSCKV